MHYQVMLLSQSNTTFEQKFPLTSEIKTQKVNNVKAQNYQNPNTFITYLTMILAEKLIELKQVI